MAVAESRFFYALLVLRVYTGKFWRNLPPVFSSEAKPQFSADPAIRIGQMPDSGVDISA
jgi:hypothetical protein